MNDYTCPYCGNRFESYWVCINHQCSGFPEKEAVAAPLYTLVRLDEDTEQESQIMTSHDHASLRGMADRGNTAYPGLLRYDVALADDLRPQAAP